MKRKLFVLTGILFWCVVAVAAILAIAGITFSFMWLVPIIGGLIIGHAIARFRSFEKLPSLKDFFASPYLDPTLQLLFGFTLLVFGRFLI